MKTVLKTISLIAISSPAFAQGLSVPSEVFNGSVGMSNSLISPISSNTINLQPHMGFSPQLAYSQDGQTELSLSLSQSKDSGISDSGIYYKHSDKIEWQGSTIQAATVGKSNNFFWSLNAAAIDMNIKSKSFDFYDDVVNTFQGKLNLGFKIASLALGYTFNNITVTATHTHESIRSNKNTDNNFQEYAIAYQLPHFEIGVNHHRTIEEDDFQLEGSTAVYSRFKVSPQTQLGLAVRKIYKQALEANYNYDFYGKAIPFEKDNFEYQASMIHNASNIAYEFGLRTSQQSYSSPSYKTAYNIRNHGLIVGASTKITAATSIGGSLFLLKGSDKAADLETKLDYSSVSLTLQTSI